MGILSGQILQSQIVKKENQIKGKKDRAVLQFDGFYLEVPEDMIK